MVNVTSLNTGEAPLKLAERITESAMTLWKSGNFLEKVSPITQELLKYWDPEGVFSSERNANFHVGQWRTILNVIYVHEILQLRNVSDIYYHVYPELLSRIGLANLKKDKYEHPQYCVKMATGTGKTWTLHALLIWQYLNAQHEQNLNMGYSKNFLLVAPGLIVYGRLLDAYLGKKNEKGERDFERSDFKEYGELFLPPHYRDEILGFIQGCVATKEEIGRKTTGGGLIAITNWHQLSEVEDDVPSPSPLDDPDETVKELLPLTPGTSQGHSLDELDRKFSEGEELRFLSSLPDLVVFNDEAHHLSEMKKSDEIQEKKWQEALNRISGKKGERFIQVDLSATPYTVKGSGQKRVRNYFPHIVSNFPIVEAIRLGLVKAVAIDRRKEFASIPIEELDFKAEREGDEVIDLSDGQKLMITAGLTKLSILEDEFLKLDGEKYPKMMIVCEDTNVVPYVTSFLRQKGYADDEITEIHTKKKNADSKEWEAIESRLFDIDRHKNPKIIVSVLMLREGFDVNNICVIVPLRSASSFILLEQLIGRGLRLMWRGGLYDEMRTRNREKLLIKKEEPDSYIDILSIVEHPNFMEYYESELEGLVGEIHGDPDRKHVVGDLIRIGLKPDYEQFDLYWPDVIKQREEELKEPDIDVDKLKPFGESLEKLKAISGTGGDVFQGVEITVKTTFGEYRVSSDYFDARSYNSFIQKLVRSVSVVHVSDKRGKNRELPVMQINSAKIAGVVDNYIRHRLFTQEFDPLANENWRALIMVQKDVVKHIVSIIGEAIYKSLNNVDVSEAEVRKRYFSETRELRIRETYALDVSKSIYAKVAYPSNRGGLERDFISFIDRDSRVDSFVKIDVNYHAFATILYVRGDGLLKGYHPDFLVKACDKVYVVETKAEDDESKENVVRKRKAAVDWVQGINEIPPADRMDREWNYVLLTDNTFYRLQDQDANVCEILDYAKLTKPKIEGTLGDYLGLREY